MVCNQRYSSVAWCCVSNDNYIFIHLGFDGSYPKGYCAQSFIDGNVLFINSQYHVLAIRYYFLFTPHTQIKIRDDDNKTSSLLFSFQLMVTVNNMIIGGTKSNIFFKQYFGDQTPDSFRIRYRTRFITGSSK